MRNLLQYGYSIVVFTGVLGAAYMAITKESNSQQLRSMQGPTLRAEATFVDPAVTQLFQMENELARLGSGKVEDRQPSRIEIIIPSPPTNRD